MTDKPKLSLVIDSMVLKTDGMKEADGVLSVPAVIARHMVYDYSGTKVLKPFDELEAAAKFADGIPVTLQHPDVGFVTDRKEVLGHLRNPEAVGDEFRGTLEIADAALITDIKDGKIKEVSGGFFCNMDVTSGTLDGVSYDAVQRDIYLNHIAVVDEGRCSIEDGCGLRTDSREGDLMSEIDTIKAERDALKADLEKVSAERDAIKGETEKIIQIEKDAIIAELTAVQDAKTKEDLAKLKLDELKKELEMVRELRADRISFKQEGAGRSAIDKAYRGEK